MNSILLQPSDVLFFRDGRPMNAGLAGHGAAWPLPNVVNAAFHAALHRDLPQDGCGHPHRFVTRQGKTLENQRDRRFGSLVTVGPFPVRAQKKNSTPIVQWFFPRPADARRLPPSNDKLATVLRPTTPPEQWKTSSLPEPLRYAVTSVIPPSKEEDSSAWLEAAAFQRYLENGEAVLQAGESVPDRDIFLAEHTVGIAIDPATETTGHGEAEGKIYSAHYLRLHLAWRLGVLACCPEDPRGAGGPDLIQTWIAAHRGLVVGGQQRICSFDPEYAGGPGVPLPRGLGEFTPDRDGKCRVKWVLLTPAIWPEIACRSKRGQTLNSHHGGWLPNWVDQTSGEVKLRIVEAGERRRRRNSRMNGEPINGDDESTPLHARLVSALVPKPVPVTGWALGDQADGPDDRRELKPRGAKSSHLAVTAGAVYYFETESTGPAARDEAAALANALNWHGGPTGTGIRNRRSTLAGEKGFGLGVCGTWTLHNAG